MGAIVSRPVLHNIETALLSIAQLVDTVVRAVEYLLSVIISKCVSRSIYRHFYVSTPTSVNAADLNDADKEGLTRICTNEGVCYIPATRIAQHRQLRKQKQDDRLKKRKMRAEWAAAGLNVDEMAREERRKERLRKQKTNKTNESLAESEEKKSKLSRQSTAIDESIPLVSLPEKVAKEEKPLYIMGNVARRSADIKRSDQPKKTEDEGKQEKDAQIHWAKSHRTRPLTAVREASHDHGILIEPPKFRARLSQDAKGLPNGMADVLEFNGVPHGKEQKDRKRQSSIPSPPKFQAKKSQSSVEAISASRIATNVQDKRASMLDHASTPNDFQKGHRPSASLPPLMTSTTALRAHNVSVPISPALVQPKPRRAVESHFDGGSPLFAPPSLHSPTITAGSLRSAATPPPAFLNRNRNSIDLAHPISRGGTPSDNDASSIRSKRSIATTATPPPYVVHLADKACKSRWESTAKERKGWKGEVKRIALNKVHEQRTAYRSSVSLPLTEKQINQ
ncbi:uncharacterized protein FA14DRAFT_5982 [Meira miltonrushii]|uniref:Uncharacterized protein n=1 Tax=Meira miltonrushii TaxID=1280837 RepID=A0A316VGR3_9BASI|nr:uncharacterized protein FA14DRAFT_5982 [Meira miltonrushii]PWN36726.1 hypothetical protein FA14DRAFT_5982 [Meira miltonrushii]